MRKSTRFKNKPEIAKGKAAKEGKPVKENRKAAQEKVGKEKPPFIDAQMYAQAASQENKQSGITPDPISQVFSVIRVKREKQSKTNKLIFDKLSKLDQP